MLVDSFIVDDVIEELTFFHELSDKEELFGSLDDFVEL